MSPSLDCLPMEGPTLQTPRLVLRRWSDEDRGPLAAITADPEVMKYRFARLSRAETDQMIDQNEESFETNRFGLWAMDRNEDHRLLGFAGFGTSDFGAAFCPAVDVGWTLARDTWGRGYATEAASAALDYAFDELGLDEVVAHTTSVNERSRAVMRRLGMTHDPADDFDAPWYVGGHPYRRFVLYRLRASAWGPPHHTGHLWSGGMEIECAECGCLVDKGVRIKPCGRPDCCCRHLPVADEDR